MRARIVARTGGEAIGLKGDAAELALADLRATHEAWLPEYMGAVGGAVGGTGT